MNINLDDPNIVKIIDEIEKEIICIENLDSSIKKLTSVLADKSIAQKFLSDIKNNKKRYYDEKDLEETKRNIELAQKAFESEPSIRISLNNIKTHASLFTEEGKQAADTLIKDLELQLTSFFEEANFAPQSINVFLAQSNAIIKKAKPELANHRGWKDILAHLALTIFTFGTNLIAFAGRKAYYFYRQTSDIRFFPVLTKTQSLVKIEEIETKLYNLRTSLS